MNRYERYRDENRCWLCGGDTSGTLYCNYCREKHRNERVKRYRIKHGIPLDKPVVTRRPRIVNA